MTRTDFPFSGHGLIEHTSSGAFQSSAKLSHCLAETMSRFTLLVDQRERLYMRLGRAMSPRARILDRDRSGKRAEHKRMLRKG
jgi:hypothetical protein